MPVTLRGKRALVSGGSSGVGAAVARLLAEEGAIVAITYSSDQARAGDALSTLPGEGHICLKGDAFTEEGVQSVVAACKSQLGGIDIVISNAGWTAFGNFNDLHAVSDDDWIKCYTTNVMSHMRLMRACQDELTNNKGSFIISASVSGLIPSGSSMPYSISKASTIHLMKSLAKACAPHIRVNSVSAGVMMTEWSKGFSQAHLQGLMEGNALKRLTDVEDVAAVYVSLAENSSMTGQNIEISAGMQV